MKTRADLRLGGRGDASPGKSEDGRSLCMTASKAATLAVGAERMYRSEPSNTGTDCIF